MSDLELSPWAKATLRDYCRKRRKLVWLNRYRTLLAWLRRMP
jgi:hypothetical protein